jgi:hypothetical protein
MTSHLGDRISRVTNTIEVVVGEGEVFLLESSGSLKGGGRGSNLLLRTKIQGLDLREKEREDIKIGS